MRIHIVGDLHGTYDVGTLDKIKFKDNDLLIVAGDFGFIWKYPRYEANIIAKSDMKNIEKYFGKLYHEYGVKTLFIDGNHENHTVLANVPTIPMYGGNVGRITDYCYHLKRGEIYTIAGKKVFTMGGALSVDKWNRVQGVSWWSKEVPSIEEVDKAIKTVKENEIDYIISHTAPASACDMLMSLHNMSPIKGAIDPTEDILEEVRKNLIKRPEMWFFGHWHLDCEFSSNNLDYMALYHKPHTIFIEEEE